MMPNILNVKLETCPKDAALESWLCSAMPKPNLPNPSLIKNNHAIFVPFLGNSVISIFENIAICFPEQFSRGFVVYEDYYELDKKSRLNKPYLARFSSVADFKEGGFFGRMFLVLDKLSFIYFDHVDVSGICCSKDIAPAILENPILSMFETIEMEAVAIEDDQERSYMERVISNAKEAL